MSTDRGFGRGGQNIIPSARKSIHCHSGPFNHSDMVRFSDDSSGDEQPVNEGVDEVDNVMSKLSHTSSPLVARRRHSMTPPNHKYTDDSDDDVLAKSLPGKLPSHSHCSDNSDVLRGYGSPPTNRHNKSDISSPRSTRSSQSPNTSNFNYSGSSISQNLNRSNNRKEDENSSDGYIFKYLIVLVVALCLAYYNLMGHTLESDHVKYDELRFHNDLTELGAKYKVHDDSMLQLQAGISTIFKREDTSCFVFVYNSMSKNFNSNHFDGFVNNVASHAANFLRNESAPVKHMVIEGSSLTMGSHSHLVKAFRDDMARTGVLLVRDLEHVPSPLAMAFHYYCDEFNPLVKKSAVFFTLNAAKCKNSEKRSPHAAVEKCLKEKWHTVPKDNIGPLLTRVVSVVVDVTDGF